MLEKINPALYAPTTATPIINYKCQFTSDLTLKILREGYVFDSQIDKVDINVYLPTDRNELNFDSIIAPVNVSALDTTSLNESSSTGSSLH